MISKAMIAASLIFVANALAEDEPVLLAQKPYPDGYKAAVRRPSEDIHLKSDWTGDPIPFCAFLDVGRNGVVSNVHVILSTGSEDTDKVFVRWLNAQQYVPATVNGKSVKVRILYGFSIGQMPPEKSNYCNWSMYHPMSEKKPDKPKLTDAERHKRFVDMAKEVEASEKPADFERAFKGVTSSKIPYKGN